MDGTGEGNVVDGIACSVDSDDDVKMDANGDGGLERDGGVDAGMAVFEIERISCVGSDCSAGGARPKS